MSVLSKLANLLGIDRARGRLCARCRGCDAGEDPIPAAEVTHCAHFHARGLICHECRHYILAGPMFNCEVCTKEVMEVKAREGRCGSFVMEVGA
jgi:hypothetical protein